MEKNNKSEINDTSTDGTNTDEHNENEEIQSNVEKDAIEILDQLMIFENPTNTLETNDNVYNKNESKNIDNEPEDISLRQANAQNMKNRETSSSDEDLNDVERKIYEMVDQLNYMIDMQLYENNLYNTQYNTDATSNDNVSRVDIEENINDININARPTNEEIMRVNTELHQDFYQNTNDVNTNIDNQGTINVTSTTLGLSVRNLKRIIVYRYKNKINKTQNLDCCVCFCQYNPDDLIMELVCEHYFHKTCIKPWLKLQGICPMCRSIAIKTRKVKTEVVENIM
ncbi:E3 ubiquitin-protein ligase rnf38 [Binucleata daphniae]